MTFDRFSIPKKNALGVDIIEMDKRRGSPGTRSIDIVSPDLCIQSSWFQQATVLTGSTLTDSGNHLLFTGNIAHVWINPTACNAQESRYLQQDGTFKNRAAYRTVFKEDGAVIPDSDVDWSAFNYGDTGTPSVTFKTSKTGAVTIDAYRVLKTDRFFYIVQPPEGIEMLIAYAEIQFSLDVNIESNKHWMRFEVLIGSMGATEFHNIPRDEKLWDKTYYDIFAYHPGDKPLLEKHLGSRQDYFTTRDFEAISNVGKSTIKAWGGRDYETIEFPFNYMSGIPICRDSKAGMRVYTIDSTDQGGDSGGPIPGTTATFTLYTEWRVCAT